MSKKIIITAGGTGGHIFPAIALAKQLEEKQLDLLFVGGNLSTNLYFERESFAYRSISCATFKNKNPLSILKASTKILWGIRQSRLILEEYRPDLIVGFGSFYTLPLLIAARMKKVPFILHEANSIPGKVNRLLSQYARAVGILFPESAKHLNGQIVEVGLPLRPGYRKESVSQSSARAYFDLDPHRLTFLIFGGSQGAVHLNSLVHKCFTEFLPNDREICQIIHLIGDAALAGQLRADYQKAGFKACVKAFESRMDLAWQAADLSIARAGAGTLAEQMEFEVPGILVPYPHASDNHQDKNADFLVQTVGGAIKCIEKDLTPQGLAECIKTLTQEKRKEMQTAMQHYKIRNHAKDFCSLVLEQVDRTLVMPPRSIE